MDRRSFGKLAAGGLLGFSGCISQVKSRLEGGDDREIGKVTTKTVQIKEKKYWDPSKVLMVAHTEDGDEEIQEGNLGVWDRNSGSNSLDSYTPESVYPFGDHSDIEITKDKIEVRLRPSVTLKEKIGFAVIFQNKYSNEYKLDSYHRGWDYISFGEVYEPGEYDEIVLKKRLDVPASKIHKDNVNMLVSCTYRAPEKVKGRGDVPGLSPLVGFDNRIPVVNPITDELEMWDEDDGGDYIQDYGDRYLLRVLVSHDIRNPPVIASIPLEIPKKRIKMLKKRSREEPYKTTKYVHDNPIMKKLVRDYEQQTNMDEMNDVEKIDTIYNLKRVLVRYLPDRLDGRQTSYDKYTDKWQLIKPMVPEDEDATAYAYLPPEISMMRKGGDCDDQAVFLASAILNSETLSHLDVWSWRPFGHSGIGVPVKQMDMTEEEIGRQTDIVHNKQILQTDNTPELLYIEPTVAVGSWAKNPLGVDLDAGVIAEKYPYVGGRRRYDI